MHSKKNVFSFFQLYYIGCAKTFSLSPHANTIFSVTRLRKTEVLHETNMTKHQHHLNSKSRANPLAYGSLLTGRLIYYGRNNP